MTASHYTRRIELMATKLFSNILSSNHAPALNHFPDIMADILKAMSRIERCSSAPSTNLLSTSEKTMTILFFCASGTVSSNTTA